MGLGGALSRRSTLARATWLRTRPITLCASARSSLTQRQQDGESLLEGRVHASLGARAEIPRQIKFVRFSERITAVTDHVRRSSERRQAAWVSRRERFGEVELQRVR